MFSHITVGVGDLSRAARFYDAILEPLGLRQRPVTPDGGPASLCWIMPGEALPRFYAYSPFNGQLASAGNGSMVAFIDRQLGREVSGVVQGGSVSWQLGRQRGPIVQERFAANLPAWWLRSVT